MESDIYFSKITSILLMVFPLGRILEETCPEKVTLEMCVLKTGRKKRKFEVYSRRQMQIFAFTGGDSMRIESEEKIFVMDENVSLFRILTVKYAPPRELDLRNLFT